MNTEQGTILALQLLAHIAADEELLNALQLETGLNLGDLRDGAQDTALHAGLLDFILQNEPALLKFSEEIGRKPETIMRARMSLPGFTYDA